MFDIKIALPWQTFWQLNFVQCIILCDNIRPVPNDEYQLFIEQHSNGYHCNSVFLHTQFWNVICSYHRTVGRNSRSAEAVTIPWLWLRLLNDIVSTWLYCFWFWSISCLWLSLCLQLLLWGGSTVSALDWEHFPTWNKVTELTLI